ncbi:MAG TPA: glycosyltransferase [Methylomirabilota bacterium]|nr:glycosyltransferase [Methylomirabilota bacterium]
MRLGVVIPCYRQERFLGRTLAALERSLAGRDWLGVLVLAAADGGTTLPERSPHWRVLRAAVGSGTRPLTPGAARNAGFEACGGAWVLFVDADVEVEGAWIDRACRVAATDVTVAGLWGRIEEWFEDGHAVRAGGRDLYRVGDGDAEAEYTATLSFYRRDALEHVGGYESRLQSEEDFELGLRLRHAGFPLRTLAPLAAKHWSAPRPSFSEVGRRWRTGLCFGPGQALRLYLGRSGFMALAVRNAHYFATLALWLAAPVAIAMGGALALAAWAIVWLALFALLAVRKKSPRLALHSLVTWTVMAAGTVVGFVRGGVAAPAPVREVA